MKKNKIVIILFPLMMLLLGLSLGASITTFILFLSKHDDLLAVISYICLALFSLFIIVSMFVFIQYRGKLFLTKEGEENESI